MKRSTLLGILLNVCFILSIFTIRYYYAKQEMDFLLDDSERQEKLISANEVAIDSLSTVTRRLQIDNDTQEQQIKRYSTDLYEIIRWSKEYEQRIQNLIDSIEVMKLDLKTFESTTIQFLKEFGNPYYTILSDTDGTKSIFLGAYGVPETLILDSELKILNKYIGPINSKIVNEIKTLAR